MVVARPRAVHYALVVVNGRCCCFGGVLYTRYIDIAARQAGFWRSDIDPSLAFGFRSNPSAMNGAQQTVEF